VSIKFIGIPTPKITKLNTSAPTTASSSNGVIFSGTAPAFGAEKARRTIVMCGAVEFSTSFAAPLTSIDVSIGGYNAVRSDVRFDYSIDHTITFIAPVRAPTNINTNFSVTLNGVLLNGYAMQAVFYRVDNLLNTTPIDEQHANRNDLYNTPISVNLNVKANSAAFAIVKFETSRGFTRTWSGLNDDGLFMGVGTSWGASSAYKDSLAANTAYGVSFSIPPPGVPPFGVNRCLLATAYR
jgi:hypothetical protein